jgi:hypothetical protein
MTVFLFSSSCMILNFQNIYLPYKLNKQSILIFFSLPKLFMDILLMIFKIKINLFGLEIVELWVLIKWNLIKIDELYFKDTIPRKKIYKLHKVYIMYMYRKKLERLKCASFLVWELSFILCVVFSMCGVN